MAAFADATMGRVLLVQSLVALLAAGSVIWFVQRSWFPVIGEAVLQLPAQGELRSGRLEWTGDSPVRLAEGRFLAFIVDLDHSGKARSPAHVQVEFGRTDLKVYSLFGFLRRVYPPTWVVPFSQTELRPWWGAWAPAILAIVGILVVAALMASWGCLATAYCLPAWLAGFFANRALSLGAAWRLAGAALMPGALVMCLAVFLYGGGTIDALGLTVVGVAHVALGWLYLGGGLLYVPRHPGVVGIKENPFV
ncbi:MAG TPA: hypothetical protein P5205_21160 [Candidatus Paceibacterota bacterium]|nr:hypothetical protein [Verrucomicrobiota bacterium]HSA12873.1 hypothetical protein [Candidatus Paceibacterota bacterium]